MSVRLTNNTAYLTGDEGQKFRAVFSENARLQSYGVYARGGMICAEGLHFSAFHISQQTIAVSMRKKSFSSFRG